MAAHVCIFTRSAPRHSGRSLGARPPQQHPMKTDPVIKRIRWVMISVMLFDLLVTLFGQPKDYWHKPAAALESDPIVRYIMQHGVAPLILASVVYGGVILLLVSALPKRPALAILLIITLFHYYGASTWLQFNFNVTYGPFVYGALLSSLLVWSGLDTRHKIMDERKL